MKRPLYPLLFAFIGGILLAYWGNTGDLSSVTPIFIPTVLLLYGMGLGAGYYCYRKQHPLLTTVLLLILAIISGMTRYVVSNDIPLQHISHLVEHELVTIEGFLYRPPESTGFKRYLYVETTSVEKGATRYRTTGKIRITLTKPFRPPAPGKQFEYGDTIRARLSLDQPRNFGDFNYREYLRRRGIYLIGKLAHERNILKLPSQQGNIMLTLLYALRTRILRYLDDYTQRHEAWQESVEQPVQVIKAMTLGSNRGLSQETRETFRNAGMYHFLVISGVHIAILAWAFHQVLNIAGIPVRYRSIVLSGLLFAYAGVTGFHFPVLRAVIMASVFYFSITCNRTADSLYSLSATVGLLLFLSPNALFEVSFQLTVAATLYILLFFRFLNRQHWFERLRRLPKVFRMPAMSLATTIGAMIGVSPLLLYYFKRLYPYSLLSNPFAIPLISLLLPSCLLVNFSSLCIHSWGILDPFLSLNVLLARTLIGLCSLFPPIDIELPAPSRVLIMAYYLTVYGLFSLTPKHSTISPP